jgi:large subunit ribosomal protein L9
MKVILLEEIRGKGGEGDVVDVATGFAVNFLFPKKLAIAATSGNLKQLELRRHNIAKREAERLDTADKLMSGLEGLEVKIATKAGEEGQLFGSITTQQITEALLDFKGIEIDRKQLDTRGPIKTLGKHEVTVSIYRDVKANINILVVDEKEEAEAEAAAAAAAEAAAAKAAATPADAEVETVETDSTEDANGEAKAIADEDLVGGESVTEEDSAANVEAEAEESSEANSSSDNEAADEAETPADNN